MVTPYHVTVAWGPRDAIAVRAELQRRSCFVLIPPVPVARADAAALLREYKGQTSVEQRFPVLKAPTFVGAIFLKKPERLQALGYVMLLALLLFSVVERRGRAHPAPRPTSKRGNLARPTGYEILKHCRGIQVFWQDRDHRAGAFPSHYRPALRVILAALDLPATIFTAVSARAHMKFTRPAPWTCGRRVARMSAVRTHGKSESADAGAMVLRACGCAQMADVQVAETLEDRGRRSPPGAPGGCLWRARALASR